MEDLAWNLLTDVAKPTAESLDISDQRELIEAVRLSTLNRAFSVWNEHQQHCNKTVRFNKVSFRSQNAGISYDDLPITTVDGFQESLEEKLAVLDLKSFVNLLTHIHSLGSYRLPVNLNLSTFQRALGAYYTPISMADFITTSTLGPKLERASRTGVVTDFVRSLRILDPACGTGVFLVSAYIFLRSVIEGAGEHLKDSSSFNEAVVRSLYGVDLDEAALEVARTSLSLISGLQPVASSNIRQGNSIISILGVESDSDHSEYFDAPDSRMPFEWHSEFEEVFDRNDGGFDYVLMNPPYERLKPNLAEFLRERLLSGDQKIHTKQFEEHSDRIREDVDYFRNSGEYSFSNRFTINTFQLFIERSLQLARGGGFIGCIVPSTLLGDQSSRRLRRELLQRNKIHSIYEFPETSRIFEGVTQSVLVLIVSKGGTTREFKMRYDLQNVRDAMSKNPVRISTDRLLPLKVIPRMSDNGWRVVDSFRSFPSLSEVTAVEAWRGELDLTINKSCILEEEHGYPLVRGGNISHFRLRGMNRSQFVDVGMLKDQLGGSKRIAHMESHRIATQQVSNMNQRWRLKSSFVSPSHVLANSCNYLVLTEDVFGSGSLWYLLGLLNSELVNWRFGVGSFNNHVSTQELQALPIVVPAHPEQKKMRNLIVRETRQVFNHDHRPTNQLNAMVFALYGLGIDMAAYILEARSTPKEETEDILAALKEFI